MSDIIISIVIAALIIIILALGALLHQQAEKIHALKQTQFLMVEAAKDEQSFTREDWESPLEAIQTTVDRGRPDLQPTRQPTRSTGDVIKVDVDDVPEWGETNG